MGKPLYIIGIVCAAVGVLSLLLAAFYRYGYYRLLDGSPEQYRRLRRRMTLHLAIGAILSLSGAVLIVLCVLQ